MGKLFLAGIGGFAGSALRYGVGTVVQNWTGNRFPFGTLTVNVVGCLIIGFLSQLSENRGGFNAQTHALVSVGVLGGFTTFSAFGNETVNLWRDGHGIFVAVNIATHIVLCLGMVWLGRAIASQI